MAPQLTAKYGSARRGLLACRCRASSSLPVPVSPTSSTLTSALATRSSAPSIAFVSGSQVMNWPKRRAAAPSSFVGGSAPATRASFRWTILPMLAWESGRVTSMDACTPAGSRGVLAQCSATRRLLSVALRVTMRPNRSTSSRSSLG